MQSEKDIMDLFQREKPGAGFRGIPESRPRAFRRNRETVSGRRENREREKQIIVFRKTFSFTGTGGDAAVTSKDPDTAEKGYEFLDFSAARRPEDRFTGTAGWNPSETGTAKSAVWRNSVCGVESTAKGMPLRFRAAVPKNGVYAVTVTVRGGENGVRGLNLYTNRRNLVRRDIAVEPGENFTCRFFVPVCEYIPVVGRPPKQDRAVYVSVLGEPARLSSVRVETASSPTLFLGGDSLVTDYDGLYPYNPLINGGSWGQNLLQYFDGLAVSNQAHGGLTTDCFRDDGHWDIVCRNLRPGDVFMMEFGHNDQKRRSLKPFGRYAANLRRYVREVRRRGAYPVLVTPMSRIPGRDEDGWYDLLEDYARSCHWVGAELHVPVIDLHAYSFHVMTRAGVDACGDYFIDTTHTNDYGALVAARFLAREIRRQAIEPLCEKLNTVSGAPWVPDVSLRPQGAVSSARKEEKPILPTDLPGLPYADCRGIRQLDGLKEAMANGLLDPCIKFFHPFDAIPRGQFLYLLFKAVKVPRKRPYQGRYCDIYKYEFDAQYVQAALDEELIDETTTPDDCFRPDDALTGGELLSFLVRSLHQPGQRNLDLFTCERQAGSLGLIWEGYESNAPVNRADCAVALVRRMNVSREECDALPGPESGTKK
jgi:lysophospholipase L1-like esterase